MGSVRETVRLCDNQLCGSYAIQLERLLRSGDAKTMLRQTLLADSGAKVMTDRKRLDRPSATIETQQLH